MKNFVSIIVPNYNHSKFLEQRIESILNQTYQNFELILLDDASTDNSLNILKQYKNHPNVSHLIINEKNSGSPFIQWNKGLQLAKGEYIWIAESDDYSEHTFLEELLGFNSKKNKQLDVLYCQSFDVDEKGNNPCNRISYTQNFEPNIWENNFELDGDVFISNYLKVKCVIPNASAVLFKKQLLEKIPLDEFHLKMKICGDWLFWIKIIKGNKVGFFNKPLNYFRYHSAITRIQQTKEKVYLRCFEEKTIRDYLTKYFNLNQDVESENLYFKWFRTNAISKLLTKNFYAIKLKETTFTAYISTYFKSHKTKAKILNKLKV